VEVEIEHKTSHGGFLWLTPFFEVRVFVAFTKQELAVIHATHLYDHAVADRRPHPKSGQDNRPEPLTVRDLTDHYPEVYAFASFPEAKSYEQRVVDGLGRIKQLIETNVSPSRYRREIIE